MSEASWQLVAGVVVAALPDSVDERRKILSALVEVIPPQIGPGRAVGEMLFHLNRHNLAQREFPLGDEVVIQHATRGEPGTPIPPPPPNFRRSRGGAR